MVRTPRAARRRRVSRRGSVTPPRYAQSGARLGPRVRASSQLHHGPRRGAPRSTRIAAAAVFIPRPALHCCLCPLACRSAMEWRAHASKRVAVPSRRGSGARTLGTRLPRTRTVGIAGVLGLVRRVDAARDASHGGARQWGGGGLARGTTAACKSESFRASEIYVVLEYPRYPGYSESHGGIF